MVLICPLIARKLIFSIKQSERIDEIIKEKVLCGTTVTIISNMDSDSISDAGILRSALEGGNGRFRIRIEI